MVGVRLPTEDKPRRAAERPAAPRAASPPATVLALQRSAGNAAVQRWLRPSGPRLMRVEIQCVDPQGKPIKLETEEKSLAELAAIALHKKNADNAKLQDELFKRTLRCTLDDVLALLRSFNLTKLLNSSSPLKDKGPLEKMLEELIQTLTRECKAEQDVVTRIGATAALALTQVWKEHTQRFPKLVTVAKEGTVKEREVRERQESELQQKREAERVEQLQAQMRLIARNMVEFLQIVLDHEFSEDGIQVQLQALDAIADEMIAMQHATTFKTDDVVKVVNALSAQVNQIVNILELTLDPLEPSPFDEPLYGEYDYEVEQRRRQVAKVLSRHLPILIAVLNADGKQTVRLRYRGSLTDALKNAGKSTELGGISMVRVMNLHEFDADAFLEVTDETWALWDRFSLLPKPLVGGKAGLRAVHSHLAFYMNPENQKKLAPERLKFALALRERIGHALEIEELIKLELAQIEGYKREKPKAQPSSSKGEKEGGKKAKEKLPGDFGFVIQPAATSTGQARTGKPYALGLLSGLGLRILELRSVIVAEKDKLVVKLPEPVETIDPRGPGSRPRAYTV